MKAYHAVSGGADAMNAIMASGELRPAWERANPDAAAALCHGWLTEAEQQDSEAVPQAVEALRDLIEERLEELAPVRPYTDISHFDCEDFLAGDYDNIFLSVDWWHQALSTEEVDRISGFVFDSERLIKNGGKFRAYDLIDDYWQTLSDFLYQPGGRKTADALKLKFLKLRRKYEIDGTKALAAVRRKGYEGLAEILFPDRLPIDWAIEIWANGARIR